RISRWRAPAKVTLAQLLSLCATIVDRPQASSSSASRNCRLDARRGRDVGAELTACMAVSLIGVHEMFHPSFGAVARFAAVAQIEHEARIARGEAAELGRRHSGAAQKDLDLAEQHPFETPFERLASSSRAGDSMGQCSRAKSYLSR